MRTLAILWLGVLAVVLGRTPVVHACAAAPPRGEEVRVAEEEAIIVWDAATGTEHFIRRAGFQSTSRSFGFLVPTPSKPELGEIDASVFHDLALDITPEHRVAIEGIDLELTSVLAFFMLADRSAPMAAGAAPVRVLGTAKVAGFDATIVEADDPKALAQWLGEHGFEATPELEQWLAPYVRDRWVITAFEVAGDTDGPVGTAAVRMSFATDRPFYPYREPAGQQAAAAGKLQIQGRAPDSRLLRVFFFGDERVDGSLGDAPWSAQVLWSKPLAHFAEPLAQLGVDKHRHLTVFHDDSFPRRGVAEVWFRTAADQATIVPPPIVDVRAQVIPIPIELLAILAGAIILVARAIRRRRSR